MKVSRSRSKFDLHRAGLWFMLVAPWVVWCAAIWGREQWLRATKNPAEYDGKCWRTWSYAVDCDLHTWLGWEPHMGTVGFLTFAGMIAAAVISGLMVLRLGLVDVTKLKG